LTKSNEKDRRSGLMANRIYELSFEIEEQGRILKDIRQIVDPDRNPEVPLKSECPACGTVNDGSRSICIRCGTPLRSEWWAKPPYRAFRR
jgi:Zn-finger in Ran binding protein and others.